MLNDSKKETWKFLLQVIISILTAIATALGTTSCMSALARMNNPDSHGITPTLHESPIATTDTISIGLHPDLVEWPWAVDYNE